MQKRKNKSLFIILGVILALSIVFYIFTRTFLIALRDDTTLPMHLFWTWTRNEIPIIIGVILASLTIGFVTLNFQTVTGSRILTPAMLGFPALFIGTQLLIVITLGSAHVFFSNPFINFAITSGIMVLVAVAMFGALLRENSSNMVILLLFGMIFSGIISSLTSWTMVVMDGTDFDLIRSATEVTIVNLNTHVLPIVAPVILTILVVMLRKSKTYDAISLGKDNAKNLGVNYEKEFKTSLFLIAIGMALSTALIGSITFLGLLAVNASRELFKTYRHKTLFIASSFMAMIALILGQAIVELFNSLVPVTVVINLVGCIYVFYLIIKENKKL